MLRHKRVDKKAIHGYPLLFLLELVETRVQRITQNALEANHENLLPRLW